MTDTSARTPARAPAQATRDGLALGLAVGTSGLAFGAAAVASGLSVAQACVLSLVGYTGASQFALAGVVAAGGNLAAGTAGAVLLGSRNGLYGLRLAGLLRARGAVRLLAALAITDESTAVALAQPTPEAARAGFRATFASLYLTWNAATLAGAAGAGRLGSPAAFGLDVVGPAAFLALLWPMLREDSPAARGAPEAYPAGPASGGEFRGAAPRIGTALGGAVIAVAATPFCPPGIPVILAAAAALVAVLPWPRARRPAERAWRLPAWRRPR
jgi:predicted branched-subunit amino acid permease